MTKRQALAKAKTAQNNLNAAEAKATAAAVARDQAVFQAQQDGATYAELEGATGLSTTRVTQVLRRVRKATTTD